MPGTPPPKKVVSTAKVQKIWEQFTTPCLSDASPPRLFRLQKYKKFESNSQLITSVKYPYLLFRLQKYKKFESNSQRVVVAIHYFVVVSTAKVQKIWEQFTTLILGSLIAAGLFRLQKYKKFESNSQQNLVYRIPDRGCFDCKSTKNLRAIHNSLDFQQAAGNVVSTAKVQKIWEQFTTNIASALAGFCCFDCKSTKNLRAIHNLYCWKSSVLTVVSTAKVQKIWEQFTTLVANLLSFSHERQDVQRCTFGCRSIEVAIPDWWCDRW